MTTRRFLVSALAMAATVTAAPAGRPVDKRQVVPSPDLVERCLGPNCLQPGNPAIYHAVPVVQPALPDGQPEVPGIQPVVPGIQPAVPQPAVPGIQPAVPGIQAEVPDGQPEVPGIQPVVPVVEPEVPVSQGSSSGESKGYKGSESSGRPALPGISWDVFRADQSCKTKEQIHDDLSRFEGSYSLLRTYGTECDQVAHVYSWSKNSNMKLFLGIYNPLNVQEEAQRIIDGVKGDWSKVDTISVGNEQVNFNAINAEQAVSALKQARQIFRKAGYQGPVVFVDTSGAVIKHPELCNESDYCAMNAHAFFDSSVSAEEAGTWLTKTINNVKSKISGGKRIVVCETGWPYKGIANGRAVPAMPQQQAAIAAIKEVFSSNPQDLILFSGYNSPWKPEEAVTFYAEPYWGINGAKSSSN
ncbi:hypothetical protein ACHAPJ_008894 [Fusarium lateritium]